jgi:hypothetical protein
MKSFKVVARFKGEQNYRKILGRITQYAKLYGVEPRGKKKGNFILYHSLLNVNLYYY